MSWLEDEFRVAAAEYEELPYWARSVSTRKEDHMDELLSYPGPVHGLQDELAEGNCSGMTVQYSDPCDGEPNPAYPLPGESVYVGITGISDARTYWPNTPKGRECALKWFQEGANPKRLFRVVFSQVDEQEIVPPVAASLRTKEPRPGAG